MDDKLKNKFRSRRFLVVLLLIIFWLGSFVYYYIRNEMGVAPTWIERALSIMTDPISFIVIAWLGLDTAQKIPYEKILNRRK